MTFPNRLFAISIFGLGLFAASIAGAQTIYGTLRGVHSLEIAVEPLDADARDCGQHVSELTEAAKKGLGNAGIALNGYDYELYLRVSSLPRDTDCFSSIDVEVRYTGKMPLPAYPNGNKVRAVLWSNGTIVISPRNQHGPEVAAVVTYLVKGMTEDWIRDNSVLSAG